MIHQIRVYSWGAAWILFGLSLLPLGVPYLGIVIGLAFIIAGVSYMLDNH